MSSLWLGAGHLVYVKGSGFLMPFLEEYKRFRFTDVQAVSIARTSRLGKGMLYLFLLLICSAVISLILTLTEVLNSGLVVVLSVTGLVGLACFALLARHLILGPTCVCDIQTSLTKERLRPLTRYHQSVQTIELIEGLVRESQAGLDAKENAAEQGGGVVRSVGGKTGDFFQIPGQVPVAFWMFLVLGLVSLAALHLESLFLTGTILFLLTIASLLLTVTLVSVVRKATPDSIRMLLWVLLALHFVVVGAGGVYFLIAATNEPAYTVGLIGPLEAFTGIATDGGILIYGLFAGLFFGFFAVSLAGLIQVGKWTRQISLATSLSKGSSSGNGGGEDE